MTGAQEERWPPIYDEDGLRATIEELVDSGRLAAGFFDRSWSPGSLPRVCQGDIIQLEAGVPVLDATGQPAIDEGRRYWIVLGNTCDFDRDIRADVFVHAVEWTQVAPLRDLGDSVSQLLEDDFRHYRYVRWFYVPPWPGVTAKRHHAAKLLLPAALHKLAFVNGHAKVVARLSWYGWLLFHSCLVRFLAREDRRPEARAIGQE
jgi:hypothetical protein